MQENHFSLLQRSITDVMNTQDGTNCSCSYSTCHMYFYHVLFVYMYFYSAWQVTLPGVDEATAQDLMPDATDECPGLDADAATLLSSF